MSKSYREWIEDQPCIVSGNPNGNDPHHIKGYGYLFRNCAPSQGSPNKISDLACIPLRRDYHSELHAIGWASFEKKYNINQLEEMVKTILKAEKEGIIRC